MDFYIDESGDFRIPDDPSNHQTAVTTCVVVSDLVCEKLKKRFIEFTNKLDSSECINGEPKGSKLSRHHREEFCDLLADFKGIVIIPITIDLSLIALNKVEPIQKKMCEYLYEYSKMMKYETAQ